MAEPLPEPEPPRTTTVAPREPDAELRRRNVLLGLALFACFLVLAGGTLVVALIYNAVASS